MTYYARGRKWQTDVYHTDENCHNLQKIDGVTEVTEDEIEWYDLRECTTCKGAYVEKTQCKKSFRYQLQSGEIEL